MWAVYLCGCTDCFMAAMFMVEEDAKEYAKKVSRNPEGFHIVYFHNISDIDTTDTGWMTSCQ